MSGNKVAIAYDNFSGNTGDLAIGLSLRQLLYNVKVPFDVVEDYSKTSNYRTVIVGGGLLLRPYPYIEKYDPNAKKYDQYRIKGNHILNCMGIYAMPNLDYLSDYKYVSVRSEGDKRKFTLINKEVHVVPCTTMLLEDLNDFPATEKKLIGIHIFSDVFKTEKDEKKFFQFVRTLIKEFNVCFIPITHYRNDEGHFKVLLRKYKLAVPVTEFKDPTEIFTMIGRLDYLISCSLHGAIFAYAHNVPFMLFNPEDPYFEKMSFFMSERGLENYMFTSVDDIKRIFDIPPPDYSRLISKDLAVLKEHTYTMKHLLK